MEYTVFTQSLSLLSRVSTASESILVGFSGGKDSLVCLDLCVRTFERVVPFFMYFIPGLEVCERQISVAKDRYGLDVLQFPHWVFFKCLKNEIFCDYHYLNDEIPDLTVTDIWRSVIKETGIPRICWGAKKADSMWRRRSMAVCIHDFIIQPLADWSKYDVLAYLKINEIDVPDTDSVFGGGVDLSANSILWLHDKYPDDYQKILKWFPYAEAIVKRREFYGIA